MADEPVLRLDEEREVPMKEGRATSLPEWLAKYADDVEVRRHLLMPEQQVHFDSLWVRAVGAVKPALSAREQGVLLRYLEGR